MEFIISFQEYLTEKQTNLKTWFGNSKVVDENRNPLVVYHGSPFSNIREFKSKIDGIWFSDNIKVAEMTSGVNGLKKPKYSKNIIDILNLNNLDVIFNELKKNGFKIENKFEYNPYGERKWYYSITDENGYEHKVNEYIRPQDLKNELIKSGKNYKVFLKIENPFIFDCKNKTWDNLFYNNKIVTTMDISLLANENGHDGVIFRNLYEYGIKSNVYVVYYNHQIMRLN